MPAVLGVLSHNFSRDIAIVSSVVPQHFGYTYAILHKSVTTNKQELKQFHSRFDGVVGYHVSSISSILT